ncbi:[acyl-carrier-protein] S-malonyltransferase [Tissierella sp. P1]|jgi:[acyl-carrier-protein] S-malonyltransferase|uniref:ACP S-malonyltransferase n=1 Tax=Tissierella TaxID=41273 RepID=UPI000BA1182E|nr:ACP S-malonyltransferase [Tissierella sp. P1]MDU5081950.1 ACP S-malonyltransferase [Bacillota bacterium]OZV11354.1 [acyl-carrier-protein] S-malonyltransferase [Tissierella sp. P1]
MDKLAFIFPGQGSQYVGMGSDFYENFAESKKVFDEANEVLNMDLKSICFNGSEENLKRTENTQPAILATSIAILKAIQGRGIDCEYTAGLSLGEYSSLVSSGSMEFRDALKVVKERGKFMQEAVPLGVGGMAAILGLNREKIPSILQKTKEYGLVEVANYNSPEQIVLSGELKGLEIACEEAIKLGAKKAVPLSVSAPFHSSLLVSAGEKLKNELSKVDIKDAQKKFISNVDAKLLSSKDEIKPKLVNQVSNSVLWQQSVECMINEGVDTFIEIGPGKSLSGFVKRIGKAMGKEVKALSVNDVVSFEETINYIKGGEEDEPK